MPYAEGRVYHDADAHIVETPEWLQPHADPALRPRLAPIFVQSLAPGEEAQIDAWRQRHYDAADREAAEREVMLRKNWAAMGAFIPEHRPHALDLLGFRSQLMFNTFTNTPLQQAEHSGDMTLAYGMARAHNRAMVEFCAVDPRLLPTGYVPLADLAQAPAMAREAIEMGCKALLVASACPPGHSPSHVALDAVWAQAQEAGLPVVMHVGGGGQLLDPNYFQNGLPPEPDFHGGAENFRSVDFMAIPGPAMQTLATLIFDGVLERFPRLRFGVIEMGAAWLPGWMRQMDSGFDAFRRHEQRLQKLSMPPSDYVRRQIRVTPYPTDPTGWIIAQAGPETLLFSSDFPHVEGGRNPLKRFEATMPDTPAAAKQRFYCDNFVDLMGAGLRA